ncbi:hypothetical protein DEFDS_1317 [Deferribacter desulfuricans SSM1]|uniref:General secretion pathway protein M n=1 Tax=Deferribacter desulfuricans (strain DSM 14783 / JCM 11476 / NBRC 101012 / SSM1) TaxID=639282 RepID=D3PDW1_DEFDS|nr:type II secretion system protein M [Deferribacter desulfuricans]BAI80784.1 hypothetical protein DEFDS_1317 [Deferribacter desulfuricans SSM1]
MKFNANKEKIYILIIIIGLIFIIYNWNISYYKNKTEQLKKETETLKEKYSKVADLIRQTKSSKNLKKVNKSLLVFIQETTNSLNLSDKISSLKPQTTQNNIESVSLRIEQLNLNEIIKVLQYLDQFENISITKLNINKRFDDNTLADLTLEVVKQ